LSQVATSRQPFAAVLAPQAAVAAIIVAAAVALWWLTRTHAASLPVWAPWDFSFVEFCAAWFCAWWYARGYFLTPRGERPWWPRFVAFYAGAFVCYAAVETRFEYLAEHQFFFNRIQHVGLHHLGPMLIALSWPGATLKRGMPEALVRLVTHPVPAGIVHGLQQPVLAALLFSGTFFFWLIPSVHFHAMIDPRLYALMNWTMLGEGLLFWCLVLDPRPAPPARVSFGARAALAMAVMFPQIMGGAMIVFNPHDMYRFYDLCGRIYPDMGALYDQTVGGLIVWIPPSMMSVVALLLVLNALRRAENAAIASEPADESDRRVVIDASKWTG
jgi:putative membrane protein